MVILTSGLQTQGALASLWLLSGANARNPAILDGLSSANAIFLHNTSAAVFGQLTWHVTGGWRLQPGLRINYDDKDGGYTATVTNGTDSSLTSAQRGVLAPQSYQPHYSGTNVSGDFTSSWAFKSGGINLNGLPLDANGQPITADETVKPESENSYEAGLKGDFLEHHLSVNLATFWSDISDFQTTVTNSQVNVIRGYLANAGKVRSRGIELDSAARPDEHLKLYLNGALTDARYVRFPDAPCPPELSGGTAALRPIPQARQARREASARPSAISRARCCPVCRAGPPATAWSTACPSACAGMAP